jgi:hypothetical protein
MQMLDTTQDTQQGVALDSKESAEACHNEMEIIPVQQLKGTQLQTAVRFRVDIAAVPSLGLHTPNH